jgi:predicted transposase YbfD/YdcC
VPESGDFFVHFSVLPDPRTDRTKKHLLIDILFIAVCTMICGGEGFTDMEEFGEAKEEWLRKYLELPHGIPSHDTFRRLFSILDPHAFGECFTMWSQALHEATNGEVIALDGKTVRHSFDTFSGQPALHMVSAWASESGLALGQVRVDEKSNEITAIPRLLELIDVKGRIITTDAMGCQRDVAKRIVDKKGDYVFCLKGNQESLHDEVKFFFEECQAANYNDVDHRYFETVEKDHGRIEIRRCWVVEDDAIQWLEREDQWPGLKSIAAIEGERKIRGKTTLETRYFISSLTGSAQKVANAAREHWAIENSLHYVLDVTFNEDRSRIRKDNAPENLVVLRRIALNMVKKEQTHKKASVRRKVKAAGWDNTYLERILVS